MAEEVEKKDEIEELNPETGDAGDESTDNGGDELVKVMDFEEFLKSEEYKKMRESGEASLEPETEAEETEESEPAEEEDEETPEEETEEKE